MKSSRLCILSALLLFFTQGCDLNISNPNQAVEERVLSTSDGIIALAIGMRNEITRARMSMPMCVIRQLQAANLRQTRHFPTLYN